jgi:hypothetical protein
LKALKRLMDCDDPEEQEKLMARVQELVAKHSTALVIEQAAARPKADSMPNPFPQPEPDRREHCSAPKPPDMRPCNHAFLRYVAPRRIENNAKNRALFAAGYMAGMESK